MPSLADALLAEPSPLPVGRTAPEVRAFLSSGGQVGLGYPTRPGSSASPTAAISATPATWGEARALYADGWEPAPREGAGVRGVRVHLSGTRVERVVPPTEVVLELDGGETLPAVQLS